MDQLARNFSDEGRDVCLALDFNAGAFGSDFQFLSELGYSLYHNATLEWKFGQGYITREGMQTAMDSLKRLPEIPYVLDIIGKMRELLAKLEIDEVVTENSTEPKVRDRLVIKYADGEGTVNISEVKNGYIYFFDGAKAKRTSIDNIKFTKNLQMGEKTAAFSVGQGWVILDDQKIENAQSDKIS